MMQPENHAQAAAHFFDAHTHVQFSGYDSADDVERAAVLARARAADVWMINVGTQLDTSRAGVELAEREEVAARAEGRPDGGIFAAIGLHPAHTSRSHHDETELGGGDAARTFISRGEAFDLEAYRRLALHKKTVAIGECGLDYFHWNEDESRAEQIRKQKEAFIAQIELAIGVGKPLMIHCRNGAGADANAFADLIEILKFYKEKFDKNGGRAPGVIHFFTGTPDDARALLDLGFSFTFGGAITFPPRKNAPFGADGKPAGTYDEVVHMIPIDRILSETDAPYVAPASHRGERNEPAYVVEIVQKLAELKNVTSEKMKEQIWENARRVFRV